jgi:hypothetical protein
MPGDVADRTVVAARRALLDGLDALGPHAPRVVLVGAQAVYVHTQDVVTGIAVFTKDADLMLVPPVASEPDIERAMRDAGFTSGAQPGIWMSGDGEREVDLLVPGAIDSRPGRRAAILAGHGRRTARLVAGIEGAVVDNAWHPIAALEPGDPRRARLRVAGPAALLVAKAYKLTDRLAEGRPERLGTKDAFDAYRLLRLPAVDLLAGFARIAIDPVAAPVAAQGIAKLRELFLDARAPGTLLAGQHVEGVGDPELVRLSVVALARELMAVLEG